MRNRNIWVLAAALVLILLVAAAALLLPQQKRTADAPLDGVQTEESASQPREPADAYLLVTVGGTLYEPIAIYEEAEYTIRQGEGVENRIHVTPDSVYMESSTCDNQDCVLQGTVTLDNLSQRVLGNMIICLPNEVTLELYTPEGLAEVLVQMTEETP